jgi:hypothetical protein
VNTRIVRVCSSAVSVAHDWMSLERHLLGQPEVVHEAVPDLEVLVVLNAVPVDRLHVVDELERFGSHVNPSLSG